MKTAARWLGLVGILAASTLSFGVSAFGQADPANLPIIGTWKVNLDKSPSARQRGRPATWTSIYEVENGGIRHTVLDQYPPKDPAKVEPGVAPGDHTYWFKLDGKQIYKDPEGPNGQNQTVSMWLADRNTIYRNRQTKGVDDERVLYRVSPDGRTLTWTRWLADKPDPKGESSVTVWDRVK
jgi:hypothetical protein